MYIIFLINDTLPLKLFKLKRGLLMNSPFANGKVDSVELIIRSFPVVMVNFVFILVSNCFSILVISE